MIEFIVEEHGTEWVRRKVPESGPACRLGGAESNNRLID